MTAEDWNKYKEDALGNYCGIGISMVAGENGYALITNIIKDGPAEKAGIQKEDYIIGINGESVYKMDTSKISNKVRGEEGTEITLNILRGEETLDFVLKREMIRMYHVEGELLEDNIAYITFSTFDDGCSKEFENVADSLVSQGADKMIIDLRYNTGGDVKEALAILDLFLEKGQIQVITKSANGKELTTSSLNDKKYNLKNIVILTNKYTASASEIVTGALIDNNLAKTVGVKTYGKGVMQSVFSLLDGSVLKLTTQEYHTPNGTAINGIGITPNYEVELENDSEIDNQLEKAKSVVKGEE